LARGRTDSNANESMVAPMNNPISAIELKRLLRQMLLMRRFDETCMALRDENRVYGVVHPYFGQEAVAAGVCHALELRDNLITYHRGHGHAIAKGAALPRMMAELFGRSTGFCGGKGGSMHIADFSVGMLGANGIVGAGIPQALGASLANRMLGRDAVVAVFFGDGATGAGVFYESLNIAALEKHAVVFVCENNQYAGGTPLSGSLANTDIASLASGMGVPGIAVDGIDVESVYATARAAVDRARAGGGPTLIEARSYRFGSHVYRGGGIDLYPRPADEVAAAKRNDPIERLRGTLEAKGALTAPEFEGFAVSIEDDLAAAIRYAEDSPWPAPADAMRDVYSGVAV